MKRLFLLFFLFWCVSGICQGVPEEFPEVHPEPMYLHKFFPDPRPEWTYAFYRIDTLVSGYWVLPLDGWDLYPTEIWFRSQPDGSHTYYWPSRGDALHDAFLYMKAHPDAPYYEDRWVRIYVKKRKRYDYSPYVFRRNE